ncbi:MAG TPA: hypothetical protein VGF17_28100 [Phytomonospora sp.]
MTAYRLTDGSTLVIRVDEGPWQTLTFDTGSFADPEAATPGELAVAIAVGLKGVTAETDDADRLVLATDDTGETTTLEVSASSTAAAALGLAPGASATGTGPGSAHLTGAAGPFAVPEDASMTVHVDGKARKVGFGEHDGHWTAVDAAENINRKLRRTVASATGDGRVRLVSPTQGVGSRLTVTGPADPDTPDAAAVLGFTGPASHTDPYRTEPARLACRPASDTVVVENLTSAPIELQLPTGRCVLPARGRLVVARDTAADGLLSRLAAQGTVRTSPERNS